MNIKIATFRDCFIQGTPRREDEVFECEELEAKDLFGQRIAFPVTPEIQLRINERARIKAVETARIAAEKKGAA